MPLVNRAPIDPVTGKMMVTTTVPTAAWPSLGGMTYHPTTGELAVIDAVPAANDPWVGGVRFTNLGSMYVTTTLPAPLFYVGGLPVSTDGRMFFSSNPPIGSVGGWPIAGDGGIAGVGLSAQPIFWAPLLTTLVPTVAGNPTFTFTRATTAYVTDFEGILRQAIASESRFQGARRVRNWIVASGDMSGGAWTKTNCTAVFGATGPTGLADATSMTATGANAALYQQVSGALSFIGVTSLWIRRRTGVGAVSLYTASNIAVDITAQVSGTWKRFATNPVLIGSNYFVVGLAVSGDAIDVAYPQYEIVDGQSNQAPSEYVSVGVLAAPYHGNAVDGVKYFATTNGNSVPGANLCLQSQTFDNATAWTKENAVITADNIAAPDGTMTADTFTDNAVSGQHRVYATTAITAPSGIYTFSVYLKAGTLTWAHVLGSNANIWANFNLVAGTVGFKAASTTATITPLPNGWYRCTISGDQATAGASSYSPQVWGMLSDQNAQLPSYVGTGTGTMYLWGAQVEPGSTASGYNPTTTAAVPAGNVVTEAAGTAIPLATMLGYVAENAATNLCLRSQEFDNAVWAPTNAAIAANTQAAPDGTLTADTLTDNAVNGVHRILQGGISATAGLAYTFSCYVKQGTLPWVQLIYSDGGPTIWGNVNLATGVVGNKSAATTITVLALPGGWYRLAMSFTSGGIGVGVQVLASNADVVAAGPSYVGSGQTVHVWGAQVEQSSDPSSYIPTTAAAVTRNLDYLSFPMATNMDVALGTSYTECYPPSAWTPELQAHFIFLLSPRLLAQFFNSATKVFGLWSSAAVVQTANARVVGAINKGASAWGGATASVCLNGGAVGTGAFAPFSLPTMGISNDGPFSIRGYIRNVKFYATRLTDAELQAMTT